MISRENFLRLCKQAIPPTKDCHLLLALRPVPDRSRALPALTHGGRHRPAGGGHRAVGAAGREHQGESLVTVVRPLENRMFGSGRAVLFGGGHTTRAQIR
jgi:hypothetical protein